ncbi:MAG: phenylalanine--tRNA ligase subunit beta [Acidobacteria bacterium]|nr:phenylalanine--tRNA ligase subunit beta [Acidobacteriota bacterium]
MKILLEWLKEYVSVAVAPAKLAQDLTLAGLGIEGTSETPGGPLWELEITTNRPDLLSHYGVARDVSALYAQPLKPVTPKPAEAAEPASRAARVEIADPDLCHRYVALVVRNLRVQPSPDWLRKRLEACGIASINNIVDVTNYVLLELGHPTHAFDLDTLTDKALIVRRAKAGEKLTTLDGVARELKPHHLVIADARRPVALAGIMGGADTEISLRTKNVLLESAWFDPIATRRAAKELGLRTEASYRFERGMDPEAPLRAAQRCAELFLELAGGELLAGALDVYPRPWKAAEIHLRQSEIVRVLGEALPAPEIERILTALGFAITRAGKDAWQARAPSWRRDVSREIDLIEELARLYGYDKFPSRLPAARRPVESLPHARAEAAVRERLEAQGFDEAVSFSLVDPVDAQKFLAPGEELARLRNPLSEELSILRPSGLPSLVEALAWNVNRGQRHVRLYEIGKAYTVPSGQFRERRVLTLGGTGLLREKGVHAAEQPFDFFALKGALEAVLEAFRLDRVEFRPCDAAYFHPGQRAALQAGAKQFGLLGQLSPGLAAHFKLRQEAFLAELDLEALYAAGLRARRYQAISRYPAVGRDFSLLLDERTSFAAVRGVIEKLKIPELVAVEAVDRFRGGSIPTGRYSLLVRVTLQSPEQTLTDEQIRSLSERIVRALEKELGATLRA